MSPESNLAMYLFCNFDLFGGFAAGPRTQDPEPRRGARTRRARRGVRAEFARHFSVFRGGSACIWPISFCNFVPFAFMRWALVCGVRAGRTASAAMVWDRSANLLAARVTGEQLVSLAA